MHRQIAASIRRLNPEGLYVLGADTDEEGHVTGRHDNDLSLDSEESPFVLMILGGYRSDRSGCHSTVRTTRAAPAIHPRPVR